MKLGKTFCIVGAALLATGCAQERIPADEADAWEISADEAPAEATAATNATPESAPALPSDVVAVVKGSAFKIEGTTETQNSKGDAFAVAHYFTASAPIDLQTSVTMIETDIEGQNIKGAVPLVTIQLTSTSGKYRTFLKEPRPIDGKQTLKDTYDIGPGNYKIILSYFKDTVGGVRPLITLNSVTFRNTETADNATTAPI